MIVFVCIYFSVGIRSQYAQLNKLDVALSCTPVLVQGFNIGSNSIARGTGGKKQLDHYSLALVEVIFIKFMGVSLRISNHKIRSYLRPGNQIQTDEKNEKEVTI